MDRSRDSATRYMNSEKTDATITNEKFKRFRLVNDQLYKVELAKSEIEHKEPVNVDFFYSTVR